VHYAILAIKNYQEIHMILRRIKKNEIIEAIQTAGLDPREFDLGEDENEAWIKHKPSNASFTISGDPSKYVGQYVSGDSQPWPYEKYSWYGVMTSFSFWLYDVKRDLETPDLWAEFQNEAELLGAANDTENTPFTSQEKKEIIKQLSEFAEYAQHTYSLSAMQMNSLNAKLDYLVDATDRLGRIDWRNILIGSIFSYVFTAAIPPESARNMFSMLLQGISQIYGFPALPSP
jgi:hypothetical protein